MALRQILVRPHLFQPADSSVELEASVPLFVELGGFGVGGGEQLDLMLVERVDQADEARRFVAVLRAELWDADENDGVIAPRDGEVIGGAARFGAEPFE